MSFNRVNRYCSKSKRNFAKEVDTSRAERDRRRNQHYIDEFENPEQYIKAKLKMLQKEMYIQPTEDEIAHLHELKTETAIDNAVHSIIERHWSTS